MMYDELGTLAARGRGIVWDSKDSTGSMAMWVALTQEGPTNFARWQLRVQGISQRCHLATEHTGVLGRQMMGCRKQTAVTDGIPRDQLGSPRKCCGVSLPVWQLPRSLCSSPSAIRSNSQAPVPTPARGRLQAVRLAVGQLGLCFHIQTAHLPPTCHCSKICFSVTFWGEPGQGWLGRDTFTSDSCTPLSSVSPAFKPLLPC